MMILDSFNFTPEQCTGNGFVCNQIAIKLTHDTQQTLRRIATAPKTSEQPLTSPPPYPPKE
jgi:hypothetical protein